MTRSRQITKWQITKWQPDVRIERWTICLQILKLKLFVVISQILIILAVLAIDKKSTVSTRHALGDVTVSRMSLNSIVD